MRVSRVRSIAAAAAITAATIGVTAPAAHAMRPRDQAAADCQAAGGSMGTNWLYGSNGERYFISNWCTYMASGVRVTDFYNQRYDYTETCEGGPRAASTPHNCYQTG